MNFLSERINNLGESQTIAMAQKSRELQAEGRDIINLSLGEPDFNTPSIIKDAAKNAIENNITKYPPVPGFPELRQAIADKLKRDNNLDYNSNQVVVSTGAKQSLINVVLCLINPGDEVILPAPYWVSYKAMVELAGGIPVVLNTTLETDYKITADQLRSAINRKTKLIIFSSPCNPSGSLYSREELKQMASVISGKEDLFVISDEIYELINFSGKHQSIAQFPNIKDKTIIVNGVSKGFSMTGWRIGYIAAPKYIADACSKMQGQFTSGASSISQMAALDAMKMDPAEVSTMTATFRNRRDLLLNAIKQIPFMHSHIPEGAFYLFPNVADYFGCKSSWGEIRNSTDLAFYLLEVAEVAVVPGVAFGSPDNIRISYATSDETLTEAMRRLTNALNDLKS